MVTKLMNVTASQYNHMLYELKELMPNNEEHLPILLKDVPDPHHTSEGWGYYIPFLNGVRFIEACTGKPYTVWQSDKQ